MKLSKYKEILAAVEELTMTESPEILTVMFPGVSEQALWSIFSQAIQRQTRSIAKKNFSGWKAASYYKTYLKKRRDGQKEILMSMAREINVPPSLLCHLVLESYLQDTEQFKNHKPPKPVIAQYRNEPSLLPDPILAAEIQQCYLEDVVFGSYMENMKRSIGEEHEFKLKRMLRERGIEYVEETKLRSKGYDKTPDAKLVMPIAVNGRAVNWIESKGSFGDIESHRVHKENQLQLYWNRFGHGMVIYWFGFVDELDIDEGVMLMDHFPENIEVFKPTPLEIKPKIKPIKKSASVHLDLGASKDKMSAL